VDDDHGAAFVDSVQPVWDAGLVDLVDTDHRVCDEVRLVSTPGHGRGVVAVVAGLGRSSGRRPNPDAPDTLRDSKLPDSGVRGRRARDGRSLMLARPGDGWGS